jgi:tRNA nucleotidyltransferase/poly(A) polymerase
MAQYSGRAQSKTTLEYRLRPALARFGDDAVRQLNAAQIAAWYGTLDNTRTRRADTR